MSEKWTYMFGVDGKADGDASMRDLLGGKGANLAEMASLGLPVPAGFTIPTTACAVYARDHEIPDEIFEQVESSLRGVERAMGATFGGGENPLLLSVRSGAAISMPGMLETILNLGMTDEVAETLARKSGNRRWAQDCYRRFVSMHADVVYGVSHEVFEEEIKVIKATRGVEYDSELGADDFAELVTRYKAIFRRHTGKAFPEDPREQLREAIAAVIRSWDAPRAVSYRRINRITGLSGTAVNVMSMVYGNYGETSGTGVLFTRNPATGEDTLYGEYLSNAQGEDVVAGIRTPVPIAELERRMPEVYAALYANVKRLEKHFKAIQDCEFTVQEGKLWMLQTRNGKRTGAAAVKIAVDLVEEGLVTEDEAIARLIEPRHVDQVLHPQFAAADVAAARAASVSDTSAPARLLGKGVAASPGAAVGQAVFSADEAEAWKASGKKVILIREETSPEDVAGMHAAQAVLTATGGMTSHAAVVARGWGKPCVAGWSDATVSHRRGELIARTSRVVVKRGDWIGVDGTTGEVFVGRLGLEDVSVSGSFSRILEWAQRITSRHGFLVEANADTGPDVAKAVELGADGVGLVRTEHQWFTEARLMTMRRLLLATDDDTRQAALDAMLPMQREDFVSILRALDGRPVTVRLLDPPVAEFLPYESAQQEAVARELHLPVETIRHTVESVNERNPMMGHRGCRLGLTFPGLTRVQSQALAEAAIAVHTAGKPPVPINIMVPLVSIKEELESEAATVRAAVAAALSAAGKPALGEEGCPIALEVGSMLETPRAAFIAGALAEHAAFFSVGSNDLTQLSYGFSRDDSGPFIAKYKEAHILKDDPFVYLDHDGVGALIAMAAERGKATNPDLKVGICGEHGGDAESVKFCVESLRLNYTSCSPFRIPVARIAAAQAFLAIEAKAAKEGGGGGGGE